MHRTSISRRLRVGALALCALGAPAAARAQTATPMPAPALPTGPGTPIPKGTPPAPTTPEPPPPSITPVPLPVGPAPSAAPAPAGAAAGSVPAPTTPEPPPASTTPQPAPVGPSLAPPGQPQTHEIEPNGSPTTPGTATTETVEVPARTIVFVKGQSTYDAAFQSINGSLNTLKAAMEKAGLKPTGHPLTIFSDTDEKGFKYEEAIPIAAVPQGKADLTGGAAYGQSPSGPALKFQHRGPYDEIDETYATITSYLDNKGLQTDSPYIEEYLNEPKSPIDPNLAVDIYIFVKK